MISKFNWRIVYPIILFIVIVSLYWPVTNTFYQQDEWYGYGTYLANGVATIFSSSTHLSKNLGSIFLDTNGLINIILGEGRIFTRLLQYMFYNNFPLNIVPISLFALVLHSANAILVFLLAKKIFKRDLAAFFGSLFFAVNSVSQSAITWSAASVNALPSTSLVLIAILSFFNYLDYNKTKWLFYSFISIYISLFFRETGIFLFILLPTISLFYNKYSLKTFIRTYWYFFLAIGLIVAFRLYEFKAVPYQEALFLTGSSKYFFDSLIVRSVLYPLTSFSLSIVPPEAFLNLSRYLTNVYYPFVPEAQFNLIAQTAVLDFLALLLSIVIGIISLILYKKSNTKIRRQMIFWYIFLLASFLPYVVISKSFSYLESRYYYVSSISWAIIFAWVFYILIKKIKSKFAYILFLLIYLVFIFIHIKTVKNDITKLVDESQTRISILNQLSVIKPKLDSNKNIFYITGDSDYYIIGNKVPFQQGVGYTLLSFYFDKSNYPKELLNNTDLFEIGKEGYYEENGYGFGYFTDQKLMEEQAKKYNIPDKNIYKFYYNSKTAKLEKL